MIISLIITFIYFCLIILSGKFILSRFFSFKEDNILLSYVFGTVIISKILYFSSLFGLISTTFFIILGLFLVLGLIFETEFLKRKLSHIKEMHSFKKNFTYYIVLVFLILYAFGVLSSPRSADAMRYHLAQLGDITKNASLVFRPYIHYNFPLGYNILSLPFVFFDFVQGPKFFTFLTSLFFLFFVLKEFSKLFLINNFIKVGLLVLATPIFLLQSTTFNNDISLITFSYLSLFFIFKFNDQKVAVYFYGSCVSMGAALDTKYLGFLFLPWFLYLVLNKFKDKKITPFQLIKGAILLFLISCPSYLKNIYYLSNPVWPALVKYFPSANEFLNLVALDFSKKQSGEISFSQFFNSIFKILKNPMIPMYMWVGLLVLALKNNNKKIKLSFGIISYLIVWYIVQPRLYPRFSFYLMPLAIIGTMFCFELLKNKFPRLVKVSYFSIISIGLAINIFYSRDFIYNSFNSEFNNSWYYDEYQWMNKNLNQKDKVLLIVRSGQSYYLKKPYLRANSALSGLIDWRKINSSSDLIKAAKNLDATYIFFDPYSEKSGAFGNKMHEILHELIKNKEVNLVREKEISLLTRRVLGEYTDTKVYLIKL